MKTESGSSSSYKKIGGSAGDNVKTISVVGIGEIGKLTVSNIKEQFSNVFSDDLIANKDTVRVLMYNRTYNRSKGYREDLIGSGVSDDENRGLCNIDIICTDSMEEVGKSDVIILTSGAKAAKIKADTREATLLLNKDIAENFFAKNVKDYLREDTVIFVITNPSDVIAKIVYDAIDKKSMVVGMGSEMDSRRFCRVFKANLNNSEIVGKSISEVSKVEAVVMGSHSDKMFLVEDSIKLFSSNGKTKKLMDYKKGERIWEICYDSFQEAKGKGFEIVKNLGDGGAAFEPAFLAARMSRAFLYGYDEDKGLKTVGSIPHGENNDNIASIPLKVIKGEIICDDSRVSLTIEEGMKFSDCVAYHNELLQKVRGISKEVQEQWRNFYAVSQEAQLNYIKECAKSQYDIALNIMFPKLAKQEHAVVTQDSDVGLSEKESQLVHDEDFISSSQDNSPVKNDMSVETRGGSPISSNEKGRLEVPKSPFAQGTAQYFDLPKVPKELLARRRSSSVPPANQAGEAPKIEDFRKMQASMNLKQTEEESKDASQSSVEYILRNNSPSDILEFSQDILSFGTGIKRKLELSDENEDEKKNQDFDVANSRVISSKAMSMLSSEEIDLIVNPQLSQELYCVDDEKKRTETIQSPRSEQLAFIPRKRKEETEEKIFVPDAQRFSSEESSFSVNTEPVAKRVKVDAPYPRVSTPSGENILSSSEKNVQGYKGSGCASPSK